MLPAVRRTALADEWRLFVDTVPRAAAFGRDALARSVPLIALMIAVSVVGVTISKGAFVAGGTDSSAYVSQAALWARGTLRVEQPLLGRFGWPDAAMAFAPPGYVTRAGAIVPGVAAGFPLVMAAF